ncbi:type II secretion system protein [Gemmiger formicilis]|uniref:type II secretion system protein n=1 Tax=Gemmiger formicilis TaxID=745368 RepID=UPI00207B039C|nr:type II secretion system protein [Gemmiger formicilis]
MEENKVFKKLTDKKGFTLVELIVVLVILAILAALLVPALTGYIDKARNKQIIAETRSAVMAAQTLVDEAYANTSKAVEDTTTAATDKVVVGDKDVTYEAIAKLAELDQTKISGVMITKDGKLKQLIYKDGKTCYYSTSTPTGVGTAIETNGNYYVYNSASNAAGGNTPGNNG